MTPESSTENLAKSPFDLLKACIHCGMCLSTCPTYRVTGSEAESPRGRLYLMKQITQTNEQITSATGILPHLDNCLGCLACETACPSGVQYGELLFKTRKEWIDHPRTFWYPMQRWAKQWIFSQVLTRREWLVSGRHFYKLLQRFGVFSWLERFAWVRSLPWIGPALALAPEIPHRYKPLHPGLSFGNTGGERVALMLGCVMDAVYNHIHWATIQVLVENGYYVYIPEQTCCGALAHHAGEEAIARDLAQQNLVSILRSNPDWIVLNSAGCGSTMKETPKQFAGDTVFEEKARHFSEKVVDIMVLLTKKPLRPMKKRLSITVAYHAACHLHHAQKVRLEPEAILRQIAGINLLPLSEPELCCGSAGIYNLEHPEISADIMALKRSDIMKTQADVLVSGNPGCLLQLTAGLKPLTKENKAMIVLHPIELLAEAYGYRGYLPQ